jgi:hypothetical protein
MRRGSERGGWAGAISQGMMVGRLSWCPMNQGVNHMVGYLQGNRMKVGLAAGGDSAVG